MKSIKQEIYTQLISTIDTKIKEITQRLFEARESRDNESKSSAGDKHETSRAMIQIEIDKAEIQLDKNLQLKNELQKINLQKEFNQIEPGSLVFTNYETYFISIGLGKLLVDEEEFYAISLASPIGQALKNKKLNETILFNKRKYVIEKIT
jgi:transcription elongation GreA/GreB family factor